MIERFAIAAGVVAAAWLSYALFQGWQRRRATAAIRASVAGAVTPARPVSPSLLYFRSDACAPCTTQGRIVEQIRGMFGEQIAVEKIDADADRRLAERYGVFTVPTTLVVDRHGTVRHANYGLADARKLAGQLQGVVVA